MGVHPDASKLHGAQAPIDLLVKKIGHCLIVEGNRDPGTVLVHQLQISHQQGIVGHSDGKATDFRRPSITKV
jgi:hypothetical protein